MIKAFKSVVVIGLASLLTACGTDTPVTHTPCGALRFENVWIKEAPPNAKVMAAYLTIENVGKREVEFTGASSPDFAKVEMHATRTADGVMRMRKLESVVVPAGGGVDFEPGGQHLMLFAPVRKLRSGDKATLQLDCDQAVVSVAAPVQTDARQQGAESHNH